MKVLLFIILLVACDFAYALTRHEKSPQQFWKHVTGGLQRTLQPDPAPVVVQNLAPEPTLAPLTEATPTPTATPSATPAATAATTRDTGPDPIAWLLEHKDRWPKVVKLLQPQEFPVVANGRVVGSATVPAGFSVFVHSMTAETVDVVYQGGGKRLPHSATTLAEFARLEMQRPEFTPAPALDTVSDGTPAAVRPTPTSDAGPAHWRFAPRPPLGWNSWDIFGTTIREKQAKEQADAMAQELLPFGYDILTVDIQWYEPTAEGHFYKPGAKLTMDQYSRLTPAVNRFPSAQGGNGFKSLADYVHSKGLRFGIHIMRGIPRQAVDRNTAVLGTSDRARDIAITSSTCPWNPDMYGVDATKPGGQAYYDSIFQMYADWGVDFVKVDDISRPYDAVQKAEIEAIRKAIDKTRRPIVLSLSPGATPIDKGEHVMNHANTWRITDDFWDRWGALHEMFERVDTWTPFRGPGHWPDADMLPIGIVEFGRKTRFTENEQYTLITLWCIARSPLVFGGDMTKLDDFTKKMLTNRGMLWINQNSKNNRQISREKELIVWAADAIDTNDKYVALFNAQNKGDKTDLANADYASPVIAGDGQLQEISVSVRDGRQLVLLVTDGGDGSNNDHVAWVNPALHGPKGDLKLTDLKWSHAEAGAGQPRVNRTVEDQPLMAQGKLVTGIGAYANSKIIYDLPPGYDTFTTTGVMTDKGSVQFAVLVGKGAQHVTDASEVTVKFPDIGIKGKARVQDVWTGEDLGVFENEFSQELPLHGAGLFRVSPQP